MAIGAIISAVGTVAAKAAPIVLNVAAKAAPVVGKIGAGIIKGGVKLAGKAAPVIGKAVAKAAPVIGKAVAKVTPVIGKIGGKILQGTGKVISKAVPAIGNAIGAIVGLKKPMQNDAPNSFSNKALMSMSSGMNPVGNSLNSTKLLDTAKEVGGLALVGAVAGGEKVVGKAAKMLKDNTIDTAKKSAEQAR